jgi:hypothetical protein
VCFEAGEPVLEPSERDGARRFLIVTAGVLQLANL